MNDAPHHEALALEARDLVALSRAGEGPAADLREADATALLRHVHAGRSVLLVGDEGVGRTTVVHAAARLLADQGAPHGVFELSTALLLAGTRYLGEWQTKLDRILSAAEEGGHTLYLSDIWALNEAGKGSDTSHNMLDQILPWIEARRVVLIGEVTPARLRAMGRVPGFAKAFVHQVVEPLDGPAVDTVLARAAERAGLDLPDAGRASLVDLTTRFLPARPQPGPSLDLLARVKDYQDQKAGIDEHEAADPAFIEKVFSIYAGLPRFVVERSTTRRAQDVRAWFEDRIVGQPEAIDAVVQAIALFKAGLQDPERPLGTFLFVGPTGVGKTELAKALATFLFGSVHRLLRFDLGEFKDPASFARLLGDPHRPNEPALLVDAVRAQPFQVVLFDELEKAHPNLFDTLLGILDEGRVTTPRGQTVDLRSCFVIATSNVGALDADKAVGFGSGGDPDRRRGRLLDALQATFRPELLNRFQHVVPFHPLDEAQVRRIARHTLRDVLAREGITSRNLVVEVDDDALDLVVAAGFDGRWGARGLQRELQRRVVLPLAMTLMEHKVVAGQVLKVTGTDGRIRVRRLDTEASRDARREAEPISLEGRSANRTDLQDGLRRAREDVEALALAADEDGMQASHQELLEVRDAEGFWEDPDRAARVLRDLDHAHRRVERLDRLRARVEELQGALPDAATRRDLMGMARRLEALRDALRTAWRQLVWMGPDGFWDALVEVSPIARGGRLARDLMVRTYTDWAAHRHHDVVWLRDPRTDDEPAWFAIKGGHAHGLLQFEAGVHRVRDGDDSGAVRVTVAPWTDWRGPTVFAEHRALKAIGTCAGKIRSRLVCERGVVLQNGLTLAENRDLAVEVAGPWGDRPSPVDAIIRRYDLGAPLVRDALTGETSGRPDALAPRRFHALLCRRLEAMGEGPDAA